MLRLRRALQFMFGLVFVAALVASFKSKNLGLSYALPGLVSLALIIVFLGPLWPSRENLEKLKYGALRIMLRFALIGPFFGAVMYWFTAFIFSGAPTAPDHPVDESISALFFGAIFLALWGYPFVALPYGLVPGLLAGASYWLLLKHLTQQNPHKTRRLILGAVVGLGVSTAYGLFISFLWKRNPELLSMIPSIWSVPGGFAGAMCALLVRDKYYRLLFPNRCREDHA